MCADGTCVCVCVPPWESAVVVVCCCCCLLLSTVDGSGGCFSSSTHSAPLGLRTVSTPHHITHHHRYSTRMFCSTNRTVVLEKAGCLLLLYIYSPTFWARITTNVAVGGLLLLLLTTGGMMEY